MSRRLLDVDPRTHRRGDLDHRPPVRHSGTAELVREPAADRASERACGMPERKALQSGQKRSIIRESSRVRGESTETANFASRRTEAPFKKLEGDS